MRTSLDYRFYRFLPTWNATSCRCPPREETGTSGGREEDEAADETVDFAPGDVLDI